MGNNFYILPSSFRIGVLRGGPSSEYDVSLQTGQHILEHLSETHQPIDILISKNGQWHMNGLERSPERVLKQVDVVFNALHGTYGEDGGVQAVLDTYGTPYTGSGRYASAVAMNKFLTKDALKRFGVKTPLHILIRREDSLVEKAKEVVRSIPYPFVVKPACGGSSIGLYVVRTWAELLSALEAVLEQHGSALVEEYIVGKEATCGVVDNFRGHKTYALPVIEIVPPVGKLFDYESKYNGTSQEICPGNFRADEKKEIERLSILIHKSLGLSHYSRSDFIVSPRRGIYFLEVNTLPGLTKESLLPKSLTAVGSSMKEFLHHILGLAVENK